MKKLMATAAAVVFLAVAGTAHADSFGFTKITNNGNTDISSQLWVDVVVGTHGFPVDFVFHNNGPVESSITDIYFDDGTLLGLAGITNGTGVSFDDPANPSNLPGGNLATPPFVTTSGLSADSDAPIIQKGVNPGEFVIISFTLKSGGVFQDVIDELNSGDLRIGLHVQAIAPQGGSDSYINEGEGTPHETPEPGTLILFGTGLVGLGLMRRRKR